MEQKRKKNTHSEHLAELQRIKMEHNRKMANDPEFQKRQIERKAWMDKNLAGWNHPDEK